MDLILQIRDPPAEGMFVFGLYLWGCAWEKTTGDLQDSAPKQACTTLPVVHLTCWPAADKPMLQVSTINSLTHSLIMETNPFILYA